MEAVCALLKYEVERLVWPLYKMSAGFVEAFFNSTLNDAWYEL